MGYFVASCFMAGVLVLHATVDVNFEDFTHGILCGELLHGRGHGMAISAALRNEMQQSGACRTARGKLLIKILVISDEVPFRGAVSCHHIHHSLCISSHHV